MHYNLYEWQKDCLKNWKNNSCHGIADVITGAGKTILALSAVEHLESLFPDTLRVKIVVPYTSLISQWKKAILDFFFDKNIHISDIGSYYGQYKCKNDKKFIIYVINSARHNISSHIIDDQQTGFHSFLIADECHHYGSTENRKIFHFKNSEKFLSEYYFSLGLSATPYCQDFSHTLKPGLGDIIYRYSYESALSDNVISDFALFQVGMRFLESEFDAYCDITDKLSIIYARIIQASPFLKQYSHSDFYNYIKTAAAEDSESVFSAYWNLTLKRKELTILSEARNICCMELVKQLSGKRIIIFGERISQIQVLKKIIETDLLINCSIFHSEMTAEGRKQSLENFRNHYCNILLACKALDEGVDVPDADTCIVLSSTSVDRQRIQRLGRILRRSSEKKIAVLYYLYITNSSEDSEYLSDIKNGAGLRIDHLNFNTADRCFTHISYENLCLKILGGTFIDNYSDEQVRELRKCLMEGYIKADYLLNEKCLRQNMENSTSMHEKNYWNAMLKLNTVYSEYTSP